MFFNLIIRFQIESFMDFYLNTVLNVFHLDFSDSGGAVSSVLSVILVVFYTSMPFLIHYWIRSKEYKFNWPSFEKKYSSLYSGLNL